MTTLFFALALASGVPAAAVPCEVAGAATAADRERAHAAAREHARWFEEAVAIWAEPQENRAARLAQARALPDAQRDLRAILVTPHPAAARPVLLAARDGAALPADDAVLWAFYPRALAVLAFVHDAGGADAVHELMRRLLRDPAHPNALPGLPGLADGADEVVRAWHDWLTRAGTRSASPPLGPSRR